MLSFIRIQLPITSQLWGLLIISIFSQSCKYVVTHKYDRHISTHVALRSDTILLGQPSYIEYVLTNNFHKPIMVEEGGDYRSGRKVSFNVEIISPPGKRLQRRELIGAFGGLAVYNEIPPGESRSFKLFLPMWGEFEEEGVHKVSISKNFRVSPINPYATRSTNLNRIHTIPKSASAELTVVKDSIKLGAFFDQVTAQIIAETKDQVVRLGKLHVSEDSIRFYAEELSENLRIVSEIKDARIVPFLASSFLTIVRGDYEMYP